MEGEFEYLIHKHPLQYGFRDRGSGFVNTEEDDDPAITERYNRCPECEQWSPCDVRKLIDEVGRLREHSVTLNALAWRMAEVLGDVTCHDDEFVGDPNALLHRLIVEVLQSRITVSDLHEQLQQVHERHG